MTTPLNRRLFLRALVGAAIAAPALTSLIRAGQVTPATVTPSMSTTTGKTLQFYDESKHSIQFYKTSHHKELLRLDQNGMYYKGAYIEDAGLAHQAFLETLTQMGWRGK